MTLSLPSLCIQIQDELGRRGLVLTVIVCAKRTSINRHDWEYQINAVREKELMNRVNASEGLKDLWVSKVSKRNQTYKFQTLPSVLDEDLCRMVILMYAVFRLFDWSIGFFIITDLLLVD